MFHLRGGEMTLVFHVRYQPPNLAISTLYWKAWLLLLVVAAFNPQKIGTARYCANSITTSVGCDVDVITDGFRFGSLGWIPNSENADGDGYDKVSVLYMIWLSCGFSAS